MAAYVIAQIDITDPETFKEYQALVPAWHASPEYEKPLAIRIASATGTLLLVDGMD